LDLRTGPPRWTAGCFASGRAREFLHGAMSRLVMMQFFCIWEVNLFAGEYQG
jgi:hypothetical protein